MMRPQNPELFACALLAATFTSPAFADQDPGPGAAPPPPSASAMADAAKTGASCAEHVPPGATRPEIREAFPRKGLSGYAASLEVTVVHGKGETVLPEGLKLQKSSDAAGALEAAGFIIPEPDAGAGATTSTTNTEAGAKTLLVIPFVPLPKEPGRTVMLLPPVPIAVSRASGELVTVCTRPHEIVVDDPISNERDPKVKANPPPRPQREEWLFAKQLAIGMLAGALLGLLMAWLLRRWLRRPKVVPVPPAKLPWIAALEELAAIRQSDLLKQQKTGEYFDRVSDCVRQYLGARYGFDGLETTTDEMRMLLKRVRPSVPVLPEISEFLADCDLVKFARALPTESGCLEALGRGEMIVHRTTPSTTSRDGAAGPPGGTPPPRFPRPSGERRNGEPSRSETEAP
jgi:hypothetical protein